MAVAGSRLSDPLVGRTWIGLSVALLVALGACHGGTWATRRSTEARQPNAFVITGSSQVFIGADERVALMFDSGITETAGPNPL